MLLCKLHNTLLKLGMGDKVALGKYKNSHEIGAHDLEKSGVIQLKAFYQLKASGDKTVRKGILSHSCSATFLSLTISASEGPPTLNTAVLPIGAFS